MSRVISPGYYYESTIRPVERTIMSVERRQTKLAKNTEATQRWMRKLFRCATELKKLNDERKRLLNPRKPGGKYTPMEPIGIGSSGAESGLDDDMPF